MLTWCVFFLNADRTIYGRYGTRSGRDAMEDISLAGFKKALRGALDLHSGHPGNKRELAGKTGPAPRWRTPEAMPALSHYKPGDTSRQGCIHCHKIHSGEINSLRRLGTAPADRQLWAYPMPDDLGFTLDPAEMAAVKEVAAGSAAEKAGLRAGDRILRLERQPVISIADVQWALHTAPDRGELKAEVERGGGKVDVRLRLEPGWRRAGNFGWRSIGWTIGQQIGGFRSELLPADEARKLGIPEGALALRVRSIIPDWLKEGNRAVFRSGLKKDDVIVEIDGRRRAMTESELLAYMSQEKKPGQALALTVLRGGQRREITLPLQ